MDSNKDYGTVGLKNLGATCYLNSTIRPLLYTYDLFKYFIEREIKNKKRTRYSDGLSVLFNLMNNDNGSLTGLTNYWNISNNQEDSSEFLLELINKLDKENIIKIDNPNLGNEDINIKFVKDRLKEFITLFNQSSDEEEKRLIKSEYFKFVIDFNKEVSYIFCEEYLIEILKRENSIIVDLFLGINYSQLKCQNCFNITYNCERFFYLQVYFNDNDDKLFIKDSLVSLYGEEALIGEDMITCSLCKKKTNMIKINKIFKPPKNLIIQVVRFKVLKNLNLKKIDKPVIFDLNNLNLNEFKNPYVKEDLNYSLYGIISHKGSLLGGHYISKVKNPISKKWYYCNDETVIEIDDFNDQDSKYSSNDAYLLFYTKN